MDGDEQQAQRHRHARSRAQQLRKKKAQSWNGVGYLDEDGNLISPLHPDVYTARAKEDEVLLGAIKHNPSSRYHELVKKNDNRDVEKELKEYIIVKLKDEAAKGIQSAAINENDESSDGDDEVSEDAKNKNRKRSMIMKQLDEEKTKVTAQQLKMKEMDDVSVYHYPRNATGYYRGLWVRSPSNKTTAGEIVSLPTKEGDLNEKDTNQNGTTQMWLVTSTPTKLLQQMDDKGYLVQQNVSANEVHTWTQKQLQQRKTDVGIIFLPPSVYIKPDATIAKNSSAKGSDDNDGEEAAATTKDEKSSSTNAATTKTTSSSATTQSKSPSLSLTKESGRAAFQLYSRPIAGMNELRIVDGLVKLYDGMTTSYVLRRTDVLLRVRGVMIHGIGKVSLVTASHSTSDEGIMKNRRNFLAVRQFNNDFSDKDDKNLHNTVPADEDGETGMSAEADFMDSHRNLDDDDNFQKEEESSERRRRRRLQIAVEDLLLRPDHHNEAATHHGKKGVDSIMGQIRDETMDLYSSLYMNGDAYKLEHDESLQSSMKENGWTRLESVDEGMPDLDDDDEEEEQPSHIQRRLDESGDDYDIDIGHYNDDQSLLSEDFATGSTPKNSMNASSLQSLTYHRSTLASSATQPQPAPYIYPYPYVIDDAEDSVQKTTSPATRRLPGREMALEANAANCEFEINMDIQATKWTYGEWRSSMEHRLRMGGVFNPHWQYESKSKSDLVKLKRSQYVLMMKSQLDFLDEKTPYEALAMTMLGDIESRNCDFHSFVNVTAMRTNWEHTTAKAINYSFYMMLTCLTQIVILLRQLLHTQSQSVATNVSLMCIGWQTVLDAILCISHIFLCLVMQPLFTAFASVAFFKLLIFCVIEMKYMAIIIQARNNNNNTGLSQEDMRRQVTLLHLKFYGGLMLAILAFWYFGQTNRTLYVLMLYSFWIPQIILNIITESRKPMHPYYMYGMSLTRTVAPVYVFAVRNNFLKEVNPDFPTEPYMCQLLILWIGIQTAILYAQGKYGTRFMIPQR